MWHVETKVTHIACRYCRLHDILQKYNLYSINTIEDNIHVAKIVRGENIADSLENR